MSGQFTVTRQSRWQDGKQIVEVNQGTLDYANPDMLSPKYVNEGETFIGMVPAVCAAISIAKAWAQTTPPETVRIAIGNTHGMTMEFDDEPATQETFDAMLVEAESFDLKLPKCAHCGEMFTGKERYGMAYMHQDEYDCCTEYCAEMRYMNEEEEDE